jgi:hypothetical protein
VGVDEPVSHVAPGQEVFAPLAVIGQDLEGGCMQRHQTGFAELGGAYRQDAVVEIDVVYGKTKRFANAQARHAEQSEQAVVGVVRQAIRSRPPQGALQQVINVLVREEVRAWTSMREGQ